MLTPAPAARLAAACLNGPICIALLLSGSTGAISAALGAAAFLMVVLFGVVVAICGLQPRFAEGFVPTELPERLD